MCVVSSVGDYWKKRVDDNYPWIHRYYQDPSSLRTFTISEPGPSKQELDTLKKEVEELKKLLIAATLYDKNTNQPHCETEEKIALIKKIGKLIGVDMKDVFDLKD